MANSAAQLQRAREALQEAKAERGAAEAQSSLADRLKERWHKVTETNRLAEMFAEEFRRTR